MSTMKAAVMTEQGGPEVLHLEDVPIPGIKPNELLVEVAAVGVCGHDQADRMGLTTVPLPLILGHEVSGVVVEVGTGVRGGFQVGDRVAAKQFTTCGHCRSCWSDDDVRCSEASFNYGGTAEYMAIADTAVIKIPDSVDLIEASIVACTIGTCLQALDRIGKVQPGESVVVTGAGGGLGIHGIQVAKAMGAYTIASTSSPNKVAELQKTGADQVLVTGDGSEVEQLMEMTSGAGINVVLDNVGHPDLFSPLFRALAERGRYVFTGQTTRNKVSFYPAFVFAKECSLTGSASTVMSTFHRSMKLVETGQVRPIIERFTMDQVVEVHRLIDSSGIIGRAVIVP